MRLSILSVLVTVSILTIAELSSLYSLTHSTLGQKEDLDNSTSTSTTVGKNLFQPNSEPYNLTYEMWTARWWQWAYSIQREVNPAYDDTGKYCAENQQGPVWFFPGTYGESVIRECIVPSGKPILLPILNSECSFAEFPELRTADELRNCAKTFQDQVTDLHASIDGQEIPKVELEKYRIQSPPFNFTLPENNILGLAANTTTTGVSDGNWLFIKPLTPGNHEIRFMGDVNSINNNNNNNNNTSESFAFPSGWNYSTTYELSVR